MGWRPAQGDGSPDGQAGEVGRDGASKVPIVLLRHLPSHQEKRGELGPNAP